jgi:hypothetical protein
MFHEQLTTINQPEGNPHWEPCIHWFFTHFSRPLLRISSGFLPFFDPFTGQFFRLQKSRLRQINSHQFAVHILQELKMAFLMGKTTKKSWWSIKFVGYRSFQTMPLCLTCLRWNLKTKIRKVRVFLGPLVNTPFPAGSRGSGGEGHMDISLLMRRKGNLAGVTPRDNGKAHTSRTLWFSGVFFWVFSGWNNGEKQKIHIYGCDNLNVLGLGYFWEPVWNRTVLSSLPCLRVHSQNNTKQIAQSKLKVQPKLGTWLRNIVKQWMRPSCGLTSKFKASWNQWVIALSTWNETQDAPIGRCPSNFGAEPWQISINIGSMLPGGCL